MKNQLFFFLLLLFFSGEIFSQKNTWLGLVGAITYDHYGVDDPEGYLSEKPLISGMAGFTLEREINIVFSVGGGALFKSYAEGVRYKNARGFSSSTALNSLIIPFFVKAGKDFQDQLFRLSIEAGGSVGFNLDYSKAYPNYLGGGGGTRVNSILFTETTFTDANKKLIFYSIYMGGNIQFKIFKKGRLDFSIHRHLGFDDLIVIDVEYRAGINDPVNAVSKSKGGFTATALSIFYPINLLFK